jgi:CRP-like cAMP-binding protein
MIQAELVKSLEAFKNLNDQQIAAIQEHCEILEYQKEDKLFAEGDDATHLWIVNQGVVDLRFEMPDSRPTSSKQTVSNVDVKHQDPEAKVLGWSCFIPPYKMRLSAYCVTDTAKIIRIEKTRLIALFDRDPDIGYRFLSYLITVVGYRFHQFQDQVAKNMGEDLMSGW